MTLPVILLEFNELTPELMDKFCEQGHLPNFTMIRKESVCYTTEAAERPPYLEPWMQWVTVHTGLDQPDHGLLQLNEGHRLNKPRIWDTLSARGFNNLVCGSMNVAISPGFRGEMIPDPWCTEVAPTSEALKVYFRFIQKNVQEYSNDSIPLSRSDYVAFCAFLATHGLSARTVWSVVRQLLSEKSGHNRWKRAALLDKLQFDVFRWYYRANKPDFSTFFVNSTAHFQHSYWREMQPEVFTVKPSEEQEQELGDAILFGYQEMDRLIGRFLDLARNDATLVFCTALSQQPCLKYEQQGGASFHRPRDIRSLLKFAGVESTFEAAPVMTHQFHLDFRTEADAADAEKKLLSLRVGDKPTLQVDRTGSRVFTGCNIYVRLPEGAELQNGAGQTSLFSNLLYRMETMKSGMHHPDGMLWVRRPGAKPATVAGRIPLKAVAPMILKMFDDVSKASLVA